MPEAVVDAGVRQAEELLVQADALRRFNRLYTREISLIAEDHLESGLALADVRLLYELEHGPDCSSAAQLADLLGLDAGYMSRLVGRLRAAGLVERQRDAGDGRRWLLRLTPAGHDRLAPLEEKSRADLASLMHRLGAERSRELLRGAAQMEWALAVQGAGPQGVSGSAYRPACGRPVVLREDRPGDLGWIVERHGLLYAREWGFNQQFEALVAEVVASFARSRDPARERCWIAERDGERLGSVMLVNAYREAGVATVPTAKLRLLLVEPSARGLGLGRQLVAEALAFARKAGYRRMTLWTNDVLTAARAIYEKEGFDLVGREPHALFGAQMVGETWEREL
jgi:DNA-binding MarR family transcriptional regulator/GNAT superfamily N-acetyltransferase